MEPRLFDRQTNALHIQDAPVPALDQCRLQLLQLWVSCTVVRRRPQLSGPNSIQQLARSTDRDSIAPVALAAKQQQQQQPGCGADSSHHRVTLPNSAGQLTEIFMFNRNYISTKIV